MVKLVLSIPTLKYILRTVPSVPILSLNQCMKLIKHLFCLLQLILFCYGL